MPPAGRAGPAFSSPFVITLAGGSRAELNLAVTPELTGCRQVVSTAVRRLWHCSAHSLELNLQYQQGTAQITFALQSLSGTMIQLHEYSISLVLPYSQGDALFSYNRRPEQDIMETDLSKPWEFFSAANRGIPYLALVDKAGLNRLALGLLRQDQMVLMRGERSEDQKEYILTLRQYDRAAADSFAGSIYISGAKDPWFDNAQAYTRMVDLQRSYAAPPLPQAVFHPTYDTWYWTLDRIDQNLLWEMAVRSQALGFKTFLIDAGWDTHAGQYFLWLEGSTGDYTPPRETFPDFSGLIDRIRNRLNMKVMLWMQQYALGRRSMYYPQMGSALSRVLDDSTGNPVETVALCPRVDTTRWHITQLFERILSQYHPDAFWFDWQEDIPPICEAAHHHDYERLGTGYNATQQAITETIRRYAPQAFVDMRWPFANLNNKPHAQIWQPIDSPGDFEAMRLQALMMRPFSAGIAIGTDEMYWQPHLSDTEAACFMATVVFTGIPYFGPNLQVMPATQTEMLKAWLRFYEENREDLTTGVFSPYGDRDHPGQFIEGRQTTFIYYGNRHNESVPLKKSNEKLYIVNTSLASRIDLLLTGLTAGNYQVDTSDLLLRNNRIPSMMDLGRNSRLLWNLPTGCLLTLTRKVPG